MPSEEDALLTTRTGSPASFIRLTAAIPARDSHAKSPLSQSDPQLQDTIEAQPSAHLEIIYGRGDRHV